MKKVSKLLVGFSFTLPVLFILLSKTGAADTMDKMNASVKLTSQHWQVVVSGVPNRI